MNNNLHYLSVYVSLLDNFIPKTTDMDPEMAVSVKTRLKIILNGHVILFLSGSHPCGSFKP
jgi:hypothetical protein